MISEGTIEQVLAGEARWCVEHSDALSMLRRLPDNSVDSMVTDPPAGIAFMNRAWDRNKGGRDQWIAWLAEIMAEAFRVLKPGAHALVWALPRTSGWTSHALEDAGFETVDSLHHAFGSGFPKSLNVSKAIDDRDFRLWLKANPKELGLHNRTQLRAKKLGQEKGAKLKRRVDRMQRRRAGLLREIVSSYTASGNAGTPTSQKGGTYTVGAPNSEAIELHVTRGATEKSREWDGFGTALKPAHEVWWLVQKPVEGTIAENVLDHGTGALNIDGCRVASPGGSPAAKRRESARRSGNAPMSNETAAEIDARGKIVRRGPPYMAERESERLGRFPANFVLTHSATCKKVGTTEVKANPTWDTPNRECESSFTGSEVSKVRHANGRDGEASAEQRYAEDGRDFSMLPGKRRDETETVEVFECAPDCPVRLLDEQSGDRPVSGGAASGAKHTQSGLGYNGSRGATTTTLPNDSGGASRFFHRFEVDPELDDLTPFLYMAKPSRAERDAGLEDFRVLSGGEATGREDGSAGTRSPRAGAGRNGGSRNVHPTVKSTDMMRNFVRLVTPPGGICVDPFTGSGSTGVACMLEGFRFIGSELNDTDAEPFASIARARIRHVIGGDFSRPRHRPTGTDALRQGSLF